MRIFSEINMDIRITVHVVVVRRALAVAAFVGYVVDITEEGLSRVKNVRNTKGTFLIR